MSYKVKYNDTIYDVLLNVCGDYTPLDAILAKNNLLSYSPDLQLGDELDTEGLPTTNNATLIRASNYPYSSNLLSKDEIQRQIDDILKTIQGEPVLELSVEDLFLDNNGSAQYITIFTNTTFNVT